MWFLEIKGGKVICPKSHRNVRVENSCWNCTHCGEVEDRLVVCELRCL